MKRLTVAQCNAALLRAHDTGVKLTPAMLAEIEATYERAENERLARTAERKAAR